MLQTLRTALNKQALWCKDIVVLEENERFTVTPSQQSSRAAYIRCNKNGIKIQTNFKTRAQSIPTRLAENPDTVGGEMSKLIEDLLIKV